MSCARLQRRSPAINERGIMKTIRTCQLLIVPSLLFFAVMLAAPKTSCAQPTGCTHWISSRVIELAAGLATHVERGL